MEFEYKSLANRIIFGSGSFSRLKDELQGFSDILILAEPRFDEQVKKIIAETSEERIIHISEIAQHVPRELVDKISPRILEKDVSVIVAIGGGSTIGLAKALAMRKQLSIIAVPTTYAGSEMTNIYGISEGGQKIVERDDRVFPSVVIYDPDFTASMPSGLAATSGVNALAHLIEALYADNVNPITYQVALKGTKHIVTGLETLSAAQKLTATANENLLLGAYMAGKSLNEVNMSLHHKVAHTLGGSFGMEHSQVHTVLLIYILHFQWQGINNTLRTDLQEIFRHEKPAERLRELVASTGSAVTLEAIGFKETDIPKAASVIAEKEFTNPVPYNKENLNLLLRNAYEGKLI